MAVSVQVQLWITFQEAKAIFGKSNGGVMSAIYSRRILARQCTVGHNWLIEYYSCVNAWGQPKREELVVEIINDSRD